MEKLWKNSRGGLIILCRGYSPLQKGYPEYDTKLYPLISLQFPWCNGYTRRHEFKSWTRLIAFHIALIPLGKVSIQLFSLHVYINSRAD